MSEGSDALASPTARTRGAPTLTFLGGAQTVTGSKTLLETDESRILIDCGLFQGRKQLRLQNWSPFPVDPSTIDAVLITHAHIDHVGYLPRLVAAGFDGPVFCTEGTRKLAAIVLPDSGHLHEEEAKFANRVGSSKHKPALPLYTQRQAIASLDQFVPVAFDTPHSVVPDVSATWKHAGHMLGAASIELLTSGTERRVVFSGDLGHPEHPLLLPPRPTEAADVIVIESTYGGRQHPEHDAPELLADAVNRTARRGGVLLIPAFDVDRTEIVLWHLDQLVQTGKVPSLPVFVDSPMASRALDVYRTEARAGSAEIRPVFHGRGLFTSLVLTETPTAEESKALAERRGPMIIVSASGMATGGRILHHLVNYVGNHKNTVLLVGFQAPGTRGDLLRSGARSVKIFGHDHPVRAEITSLPLSAHGDRDDLLRWVGRASAGPETIYINHGELEQSSALRDTIEAQGFQAIIPEPGERVRLDGR